MLATNGPRWFDHGEPDARWQSVGISLLLTAAMFSTALVAMRSIAPWRSALARVERPVAVRLTPPPVETRVKAIEHRTPVVNRPPAFPAPMPTQVPPLQTSINAPVVAAAAPSVTAPRGVADSSAVRSAGASGAAGTAPAASIGGVYAHGAPISPAGVVAGPRGGLPAFAPDFTRPPTGEEKATLDESHRIAARMERRATTSGNSADVHVPIGAGKDGVGADTSGFGRIALPLLSRGPSASQRRRDEAIYREYLAALARLQKRIATRRDSVLTDSLRADSIAKARPRIVP
jgi:hypothetical protein